MHSKFTKQLSFTTMLIFINILIYYAPQALLGFVILSFTFILGVYTLDRIDRYINEKQIFLEKLQKAGHTKGVAKRMMNLKNVQNSKLTKKKLTGEPIPGTSGTRYTIQEQIIN